MKAVTIEIETKRGWSDRVYPGLDLQWKVVDEDQGIIRGYLAVFNVVDSVKDRVRPGAFKKTIAEALQRKDKRSKKFLWPLLWMHDPEKPIGGFIDALEDKYGLLVTAQLDISTNAQGIPLNPLAMSVFSGFKMGYIDELSIGYKAIQKSYEAGTGIRDLAEIQNFEGSAVTMNFAANDQAVVTDVKTAGGSFPLADRTTPWSKSKAIKDIEAATGGDWSKASKYFFWSAPNPKVEDDHKFPFAAKVGGTFKAIPHAIFNAAARLSSAKGVDVDAIKAKMAPYYKEMGLTPPWSSTGEKGKTMDETIERKDFGAYYQQSLVSAWSDKWYGLTRALRKACEDALGDGDNDSDVNADVQAALDGDGESPGFIHALMDWISEGVALGYSPSSSNVYGYMTRPGTLDTKAGAVVSKDNAQRLQGHIDNLRQVKDMVHSVAEDMSLYITGGAPAFVGQSGADQTGKRHEPRTALKTNDQPLESTDDLDQFTAWLTSNVKQPANS